MYKSNYSNQATRKIVKKTIHFNLGTATSIGEGKHWTYTSCVYLKGSLVFIMILEEMLIKNKSYIYKTMIWYVWIKS